MVLAGLALLAVWLAVRVLAGWLAGSWLLGWRVTSRNGDPALRGEGTSTKSEGPDIVIVFLSEVQYGHLVRLNGLMTKNKLSRDDEDAPRT